MNVEEAVSSSVSISETLRKLGRARVGTNYQWLRSRIEELNLDTSHWRGVAHGTSGRPKYSSEVLTEKGKSPTRTVKAVVLREKLVPYMCALCGSPPEWNGKPLVLRLDHINGVRDDHRLENLRFLCPNCDSQTDTFCGKNRAGEKNYCSCGKQIRPKSKSCYDCFNQRRIGLRTKIQWPPVEELLTRLRESNYLTVAKELGVSDNAIRKHLGVRKSQTSRTPKTQ